MKANRTIIKIINWVLAGVLSIFGFAGCEIFGTMEYGTPNADYTVKGAVVDNATGNAIKGIRVSYNPESAPKYSQTSDKRKDYVFTDAKGEFKITKNDIQDIQAQWPVFVEDVDGEENGLFQSETLQVDFSKAEHSGKSKHWYKGEYTVAVNVELSGIKEKE